jgi:hypothetical protein
MLNQKDQSTRGKNKYTDCLSLVASAKWPPSRRAELSKPSLLAEVKPPLQKLSKKEKSLRGLRNAGTKFA